MRYLALLGMLFAVAGCSHLSGTHTQTAVYDFGIAANVEPRHLNLRFAGITAAPGLNSTEMHYRLAYKNLSRVYVYTESQWLTPPAELFAQHLRQRVAFDATSDSACKLRLELISFDQIFDSSQAAHGVIHLRATLSGMNKNTPIRQQDFVAEKSMNSPDAHSGVIALTTAANQAMDQLISWTENTDCRQ